MTPETKDAVQLDVLYSQVCIFDSGAKDTFNDWREDHVRQGFAWRPGSASFGTLECGSMTVEVVLTTNHRPRGDATRAIRVPFTIPAGSKPVVAVVGDEQSASIPSGEYALVYEHGMQPSGDKMWCVFTFVPEPAATPAILVADPELSNPPDPLLMDADPA